MNTTAEVLVLGVCDEASIPASVILPLRRQTCAKAMHSFDRCIECVCSIDGRIGQIRLGIAALLGAAVVFGASDDLVCETKWVRANLLVPSIRCVCMRKW